MTLISCDASCPIKDLISVRHPPPNPGSIWGLYSLLIITIIIWTWKERNKCCTTAKEKPWSPKHLHSSPSTTGCTNVLPTALSDWVAQKKLAFSRCSKQVGPPPSLSLSSSVHCHSQPVALGGSPPCWLLLFEEAYSVGSSRETEETKNLKIYLNNLFIILIPLMISWASCTAFPH